MIFDLENPEKKSGTGLVQIKGGTDEQTKVVKSDKYLAGDYFSGAGNNRIKS